MPRQPEPDYLKPFRLALKEAHAHAYYADAIKAIADAIDWAKERSADRLSLARHVAMLEITRELNAISGPGLSPDPAYVERRHLELEQWIAAERHDFYGKPCDAVSTRFYPRRSKLADSNEKGALAMLDLALTLARTTGKYEDYVKAWGALGVSGRTTLKDVQAVVDDLVSAVQNGTKPTEVAAHHARLDTLIATHPLR